jgi:hypothetical protein
MVWTLFSKIVIAGKNFNKNRWKLFHMLASLAGFIAACQQKLPKTVMDIFFYMINTFARQA